jgi:hypothetical protein
MLDSDTHNADSFLDVRFYICEEGDFKGKPFIKIEVPGDKTNIFDQPVNDNHKARFPRQWLHFQMQHDDGPVIGTPLKQWRDDAPEELSVGQMEELQILRFGSVEQLARASDAQLQRIGMGAAGLRERAKAYLDRKNRSESSIELEKTRNELEELKQQMQQLLAARSDETMKRGPGRPRRETIEE